MIYVVIAFALCVGMVCLAFVVAMMAQYRKRIKSSHLAWQHLITGSEVWFLALLLAGCTISAVVVWFLYSNFYLLIY